MTIYETIQVECFIFTWTLPALFGISVLMMIIGAIARGHKGGSISRIGLYAFISLIIISVLLPNTHCWPTAKANAITNSNLRAFETSLINYSIDHDGQVPTDFTVLLDGYIEKWPENVYTGDPMRNVRFGTEPCHGEFTYLPVFDEEKSIGFFLIGYGSPGNEGNDITLDGETDKAILVIKQPEDLDPELLAEILNSDT